MMRFAALGLSVALGTVVLAACSSDEATPTPSASPTPAAVTPSATAPPALTATSTATAEPTPLPPPVDAFTGTGQLGTPRWLHTATLLDDGRVLVTGGSATYEGLLASAELFQPGSPVSSGEGDPQHPAMFIGGFFETGPLNEARQTHAATRLADGRVLITGGVAEGGAAGTLSSAEIYDPAAGTFQPAGEMTVPRLAHASTLLADGHVLIVGGSGNPYVAEVELFNPETGEFTPTGSMRVGRLFPSLIPLKDGRVLVAGTGFGELPPPEIYDPATGRFETLLVSDLPADFRWPTSAVGLAGGRILLTGDCCEDDGFSALPTAAILDPASGMLEVVAPLVEARFAHEAVLLFDGRVLLTGGLAAGQEGGPRLASAELFDPRSREFTAVGPMTDVRQWHTMTPLADGDVLIIGANGDPYVRSAERFGPRSIAAPWRGW